MRKEFPAVKVGYVDGRGASLFGQGYAYTPDIVGQYPSTGASAAYLQVGRQYALIGVGGFYAPGSGSAARPSSAIVIGDWDQTWRSFYQDARSVTSTAPASLSPAVAYQYLSDEDGGGVFWCPEGLLLHKSGRLWHVSRFTDLAEHGAENHKLIARLLGMAALPYSASATAELALTGLDRTRVWSYPDGSAYYNYTDDVLTVLVGPSDGSYASEEEYEAKLWLLRPNSDLTALETASQGFAFGASGSRRNWGMVGQAGRKMAHLDLVHNEAWGYVLNTSAGIVFDQIWHWTGIFEGALGVNFVVPGRSGRRNYSPPWYGGKFYTLSARRSGESNFTNLRIYEEAFDDQTGERSEIELYAWDAADRSDPTHLSINDTYATQVLEALQAAGDTRVPATGDYEETEHAESSLEAAPDNPGTDNVLWEWTRRVTKRWLGARYENYAHEWSSGGPANSYPVLNFPKLGGFTDAPPVLVDNVGGVPLAAVGTPLPAPNRIWFGRAFWTGQSGENIAWNASDVGSTVTWNGSVAYDNARWNQSSQSREITTSDGWRFRVTIVPDVPVFVPNTLSKDGEYVPTPAVINEWTDSELVQWVTAVGTDGITYNSYRRGERRWLSCVVPVVRWTYKTMLYATAPNGTVHQKELSQRWTGLPYPGVLDNETSEPTVLTIAEEVSIAENCYQLFTVPRHNLLGILMDQRTSGTADPEPMVLLLDRTDNTFTEKYRVPASSFYPSEALELWDDDQILDGVPWARTGQYKYLLHGWDETGPLCKLLERASETLLLIGSQAYERVAPEGSSIGHTNNSLTLLRLNATSYDVLAGSGVSATWSYGSSGQGGADDTFGPRVVRSAVILDDRVVYACNTVDGPALRQIA